MLLPRFLGHPICCSWPKFVRTKWLSTQHPRQRPFSGLCLRFCWMPWFPWNRGLIGRHQEEHTLSGWLESVTAPFQLGPNPIWGRQPNFVLSMARSFQSLEGFVNDLSPIDNSRLASVVADGDREVLPVWCDCDLAYPGAHAISPFIQRKLAFPEINRALVSLGSDRGLMTIGMFVHSHVASLPA